MFTRTYPRARVFFYDRQNERQSFIDLWLKSKSSTLLIERDKTCLDSVRAFKAQFEFFFRMSTYGIVFGSNFQSKELTVLGLRVKESEGSERTRWTLIGVKGKLLKSKMKLVQLQGRDGKWFARELPTHLSQNEWKFNLAHCLSLLESAYR